MFVMWSQNIYYAILVSPFSTELLSNDVILVKNKVYILESRTLNITQVRGEEGYNRGVKLKFSQVVYVGYLYTCV